jgi:hypothetical protein
MPLKSKIATFRAGLPKAIDDGVNDTAEQVADAARGLVAVDTGALRASIEVFGAGGSGERTVEAGQSLDYAPFVEYGGKAAAQPFMTPAAEQGRPLLPKNVGKHIKALEGKSKV